MMHGLWIEPGQEQTARDIADRLPVIELTEMGDLDHGAAGQAIVRRYKDGFQLVLAVRPELTPSQKRDFCIWARERLYVLLVTGDPSHDGWEQVAHGEWRVTDSLRGEMPPDPFSSQGA
jgi:hypothetical protein